MFQVRYWIGDLAIALAVVALGLVWTYYSWRLGLGDAAEPGAGLFPFAISILLCAGGAGCAMRALGQRTAQSDETKPVVIDAEAVEAAFLIAALCLLFYRAVFVVAGLAFMWLMLAWVGRVRPLRALLASVVIIFGFWLVFDRLLGIELPSGWLDALLSETG